MKDKIRTQIYTLAFGGKGIGKVNGKVCFIEGALPGEEVLFHKIKEHARYIEGELLEILKSSKDRVDPVCPLYSECGGCQLQHLEYSKELYYKENQVLEILSRIGGSRDFICQHMEKSVPEYGYRSTIDVHRAPEGYYGFYKKKSNEILPVASCPVAEDALNRGISMVNSSCRSGEVAIKADNNGGIWISDHAGDRFFKDRFRGKELFFSPRAFSQANRYIAEKISVTLDEWIGSDTEDTVFFDLYCGVGFFSFLTERVFNVCVGIDESRIAIDCAKTTLKTTRAGACKFYRGVVEKDFFDLFDRNCLKRNIIFLDPPRKGASRKFLERLSGNDSIDRIYYLSCDPPRLARDTGIITSGTDFILNRIRLFDMFPRTTHIETLAEFTRKN